MEAEIDELRLHLLNTGQDLHEDTLRDFIESCADTEVEEFQWALNKTSVVVTFKSKPDVSAVKSACQKRPIEGHTIDVKTVPRSRCLKVTGLARDCTDDSVRCFFENKKRGGPVQDIEFYQEKQTAIVRFEQHGVAEGVYQSSPHTLRGCKLGVSIIPDLPGFVKMPESEVPVGSQAACQPTEIDEMKILVLNIGPKTSEDTLRNFFENKADADVKDIEWGRNKETAVVSFDTKPDIEVVRKGCAERNVDGQRFDVQTVSKSKCIKVTGLSSDTTEDTVRFHFENKKKGGGPVEDVQLYREANTALVRFEQYGVAEKVCPSQDKLRGHNLTVTMHTDIPGFFSLVSLENTGSPRTSYSTTSRASRDSSDYDIDRVKLFVKNINPNTSEDTLTNLLESKTDTEITDIEWGMGKTAAVVTFDSEPDLEAAKKGCESRKLKGQKLEIETVKKSRCVKVMGLSPNTSEDSVHCHFENKKKGGGPVDCVQLRRGMDTAFVRFKEHGVVENVCSQSHQLDGKILTVIMQVEVPGFVPMIQTGSDGKPQEQSAASGGGLDDDIEPLQLVITGINPVTSEDALTNFLEAKTDADVTHIEWGQEKTAAVVTFKSSPDTSKLKAACKTKQIENHTLSVECVPKSRSVKVTGLPPNASHDSVRLYFENKKRSGSGTIGHFQLISDRNTAIIRFEEVEVADRVCSMKHKVTNKDVTVVLHRDIPGFISVDDDSEDAEEDSEDPDTNLTGPPKQTTHWPYLIKDIPPQILRFLNKSEQAKMKLKEDVKRWDGVIRFIAQPNGIVLEISKTDSGGTAADKNAWIQNVDCSVKKSIEDMDLVFEELDIPADVNQKQMNELLREKADEMQVRRYLVHQVLHIVGNRQKVKEAIYLVKEMMVSLGPKETDSYDVKKYQMYYLQQSEFLSDCCQKFPSVEVHLKTREVKVEMTGPKQVLQSVKLYLLETITSLCVGSYTFKTDLAVDILKGSSLHDNLKDANILCVWNRETPNKIKLFSKEENDIEKAKDIIKKTICEETVKLDKSTAENLKTADWRERRRTLMDANKGRLQISEDSDVVSVAADSDIFEKVITEINKFFDINTVRHVLVPADTPQVRFLKEHTFNKIRHIKEVTVDFEEGSYSSGIHISGLNEGIAKARKEIEKLLGSLTCKDLKLFLPGINYFFKKGKGKDMLTAIEKKTCTIIVPGDKKRNKRSVKSWTTSAGVVSVVKGDMCQLSVGAIAFASDKDLKPTGGLGKAIAEHGGKDIQEEAEKFIKHKGRLSDGDVVCTGSGHLSCKSVLHVVVPKWQGSSHEEMNHLRTVLIRILKKCDKKDLTSVALPALGTGQGYPLPEAVKVIVETLQEQWGTHVGKGVQEIVLCDVKPDTIQQFVNTCDSVLAGARPRRQITEDSDSDSDSDSGSDTGDMSGSGSESNTHTSDMGETPSAIRVIVGELSKQKVDVLVNPTGKDLNMSVGAVSKSLLQAGGEDIQTECNTKYSAGVKIGQIAVSAGGQLSCKKIFHGVLQQWHQGKDASDLILKAMVFKCLKTADTQGFNSIAFPALGTGKLGFPPQLSKDLMFQAASGFLKNNPETSVQAIYFVIHHKDAEVKAVFEGKGSNRSGYSHSGAREEKSKSRTNKGNKHESRETANNPDTYKRGCVKVDFLKGDITREKTDCIVSCSDESFKLRRGALSKAILAQAGSKLQDECTSKKEELTVNGLAVTNGYKLNCKSMIHLKTQKSPRDWGTLLLACLEKAEELGMTSISMPALGTGGLKMSPEKMASSLLYAVNKFADRHSHSKLTLIRVVIFQGPMVGTYKSVFAGSTTYAEEHTDNSHHHRGGSGHRPDHKDHSHVKPDDQIILCIYADSRDNIVQAKHELQALCKDEFDQKMIDRKWASTIENLDDSEMSHLYELASKHRVVLVRKGSELELTGRTKDVSEVKQVIVSKFTEDKESEQMKEEARMVQKMEESPIKIERFQKAIRAGLSKMVEGEKKALAGTKTVYFKLKPKRSFKGNAEDLHFRTADFQFYRLLGSSSSQFTATMVEYVVNPALIQKFRAAQESIKKKRGEDKAEPVLAFHGTDESYIKSICEGGFKKPGDKGFASATDAGYLGSGVYFSEYSTYSMDYIKGAQKLLLCKVIQGLVYKCTGLMNGSALQSGYDSHMSPDGKELIIFDTSCILPCYIVHYDTS